MIFLHKDAVHVGDKLKVNHGLDCLKAGQICEVKQNKYNNELYVECGYGTHYLRGDLGYTDETRDRYIGFSKVSAES
jgi:hypothetical protein